MSDPAIRRLTKEYSKLQKDLPAHIDAKPTDNILEWYFVFHGLKECDYEGGVYVGRISFPIDYPLKPPSIYMITPNGRFSPNRRLCFSMSDYHPELWNPLWTVSSILIGLLSFMLEEAPTAGSISSSPQDRRRLALASATTNRTIPKFVKLFPKYVMTENPTISFGDSKSDAVDVLAQPSKSTRWRKVLLLLFWSFVVLLIALNWKR